MVRTKYRCVGEQDNELSFEPNRIVSNGRWPNPSKYIYKSCHVYLNLNSSRNAVCIFSKHNTCSCVMPKFRTGFPNLFWSCQDLFFQIHVLGSGLCSVLVSFSSAIYLRCCHEWSQVLVPILDRSQLTKISVLTAWLKWTSDDDDWHKQGALQMPVFAKSELTASVFLAQV